MMVVQGLGVTTGPGAAAQAAAVAAGPWRPAAVGHLDHLQSAGLVAGTDDLCASVCHIVHTPHARTLSKCTNVRRVGGVVFLSAPLHARWQILSAGAAAADGDDVLRSQCGR